MIYKNKEAIAQLMIDYITQYNLLNKKNIDIREGTVFKDVIINSPATALEDFYSTLNYLYNFTFLEDPESIEETDLDTIAANYGITRNKETFSTTIIDFISDEPTDTIIIPAGTIVKTKMDEEYNEIQFQTTTDATININNLSNYQYTEVDGRVRYKVSVPAASMTPGKKGNVSIGTVTVLVNPIPGIAEVRNSQPGIGGADKESNISLADRIKTKLLGNNIGTENGLRTLIYDSRILDLNIVKPGDPDLVRGVYGGEIDIFIKGEDIKVDELLYRYIGDKIVKFRYLPLVYPNSVRILGTKNGQPYEFINGTDFIVKKDQGMFEDSIKEKSYIEFVNEPDLNTNFTVRYNYDVLTIDLQNKIDQSENKPLGSDILIKRSKAKTISIVLNIEQYYNIDKESLANLVSEEIVKFISNKKLKDKIYPSDIVGLIDNIPNAENITLVTPNFPVFCKGNEYFNLSYLQITIDNTTYTFNYD